MKTVKPLIDRPFLPEEVERLADVKRKKIVFGDEMLKAQIIGGNQENTITGAVEVIIILFIYIY